MLAGEETARWPRNGLCTIYHFPSALFKFCPLLLLYLFASLSFDYFCVYMFIFCFLSFAIAVYVLLKFNPTSIKISFVKRARWAFNRVSHRVCLFLAFRCQFLFCFWCLRFWLPMLIDADRRKKKSETNEQTFVIEF